MEKYVCVSHGISVTVNDKKRNYDSPPGSYALGVPQCKLLTMKVFTEGKSGNCEIKRVE